MSHVTYAFSTLGVQSVISNGCWIVTVLTPKKPGKAHGNIDHRKPNSI